MLESVPTLAPRLCFALGDIVFRIDEPSDFLYEVTLGAVRLVGKRADGTPGEVAVLEVGALLGLDAIFGEPRRHHAVAHEEQVELRPVDPESLDDEWLRHRLLHRLRAAEQRALDGSLRRGLWTAKRR
jgi:CRP-like cAMP-binding protein